MPNERARIIVEAGLTVALAAVLSLYKITLPWNFAGGSISLGMVPLFVFASRRGVLLGVLAGLLFGVVDYFMEPFFVHPIQVLLDYGVGFAACGLAGVTRARIGAQGSSATLVARTLVGSTLGGVGRFGASFVSGMVFFAANAPKGQPVWIYSLLYNASYLLPSVALCAVLAALVVPALDRAVPVRRAATSRAS